MKLFKYFVQNKVWKRAFVIKKLLSNYSDSIMNKLEMDELIDKFYSLEYHQFISNVAYDISLLHPENTSEQNWFEAEHQYREMEIFLTNLSNRWIAIVEQYKIKVDAIRVKYED